MEDWTVFFVFLLNRPNLKKHSQNEHLNQFSDKSDEKVAREETYLLKLKFYNTDRKMKSIVRRIFISKIVHPNFMHFRQKISFKRALEIFIPVSGLLRTALNELLVSFQLFKHMKFTKHQIGTARWMLSRFPSSVVCF